ESHINDAEVDTLIAGILSETDDAARQELYTRLQQRFFEAGTLLNVQVPYLVAMKEGVTDFRQPITMLPQYKYASIKASE
ncbi:MAG: hypothetical protein RBT68_09950, partial [Spirochaetia bacterium]|nr:hypothetical protein [Spirochaetia bacterium]